MIQTQGHTLGTLLLATILVAGAGLVTSCVLTDHVDLDTLRHRSERGNREEESNGRRTWTGDGVPEFSFKDNEPYFCGQHGDVDHTPHYNYDIELEKGESGWYRLYFWNDGKAQGSLSAEDGTPIRQGDSVYIEKGRATRVSLPEMSEGDQQSHSFVLGVNYRGFEKTLAKMRYQGVPAVYLGYIQKNTRYNTTSFRVIITEDIGWGYYNFYVDGKRVVGYHSNRTNPRGEWCLAGNWTKGFSDKWHLFRQYSPGRHELKVIFEQFSDERGRRTEVIRREEARAWWDEPEWGEDEPCYWGDYYVTD